MNKIVENLFHQAQSKGTGRLAAGFMDLTTGEAVYLNGDISSPTASVYKIFVLCQLFHMQKERKLSFCHKHILSEQEKSIGSGVLEKEPAGTEHSLMDYIMLMMSVSDNTATDYLVSLAGKENIRINVLEALELNNSKCDLNCMENLTGCYNTTLEEYRKMCESDSWYDSYMGSYFLCQEEKNNQTTPKDMVKLLSLMNQGQAIDPDSDRQMLDIMAQCKTNARIPALLPDSVRVEHKTGTIDHLANDVGIVRTHKGDYILALFYNGNIGSREEYTSTSFSEVGNKILSELSFDIYNAFIANK